ncbi:sigma-54-dependent Fis family transcriptional regulator [Ammoniphilus sp. CFH 90114]|uniref:sigma-54 interaction domain-containing protein n=1 Tax=Ammoniphilus sp. CFH 90114 TaxID=2493665 RepID=UPI00100FDD93|nr:sigma 54-interacting transcriptional regulator [Ammoniphilus sp. CFH 90114]RXT06506.1 PAS domain S-box protein [Ammoniphilus sp. CFH 90114]
MNKKPLSLWIMGHHQPFSDQLNKWAKEGFITITGEWTPSDDRQVGHQTLPSNLTEKLDVILLTETTLEPFIKVYQQTNTMVIHPEQFWVLERLMDQEQQQQTAFQEKQWFQTMLKYSHEGVQFVDAQGTVQYINPAFSRITNISAEQRIGKSIFDVSPDGALVQTLRTQTEVIGYRTNVQGSGVEVISNAAPIFVDGNLIGAITTFQDVTEIKHLSQQIKDRDQEIMKLHDQLRNLHAPHYSFQDIVGEAKPVNKMIETAKKASRTRSTVLITGESGTGKELIAHSIHTHSDFNQKPFVIVNCAAIPEALLESELFGYEKGAFTHAVKQKIGKIELAHEGTLFLDEIGDMSLPLQAKLLRVIQSREFERVGGLDPIQVQVRVIAATNQDMQKLVAEGRFREDLYYRLNVVRIEVPPLRERIQDLSLLVERLLVRISQRVGLSPMTITRKGIELLSKYHWPGNIRELENFLERLMNESNSSVIPDSLIERHLPNRSFFHDDLEDGLPSSLTETDILPLRDIERLYLIKALDTFGRTLEGKKKAARALGISLATLYNKLKEYS